MRHLLVLRVCVFLLVASPVVVAAQSTADQSASIPRLITVTGVYRPADGKAPGPVETVTLSVYADEAGGAPLFQETQQVTLDDRGRYSVVLGAAHADGIPPSVFGAGGQWLGTVFERTGEVEGPRARLTSVPYAMRAAEADTLGGRPASDYQLAAGASGSGTSAGAATRSDVAGPAGTVNFVPKYVDAVNLGDSALYESGGMVGLGTTTPFDVFHVRYTNTGGNLTGLAVQNLGNTATSYSGMLFYDQNNQLGQFQGFNNVTHEYRINNVARNGASAFDGSINFMTGSTSRFLVTTGGTIGIGTTAPSAVLDVSNALIPSFAIANVAVTSYGANSFGSEIAGRKARGTAGAPTAVLNNDALAIWGGKGYGASGFSTISSGISVHASENWTDTAQGTLMNFTTTPTGSTQPLVRMTLSSNGNVGIGTFGPGANLEVSNANNPALANSVVLNSSFAANGNASVFIGRKARGTSAAPTAVLSGDSLVGFLAQGYGATAFSGNRGGIFVGAAENWTDTAQGTRVFFNTTATGTNTPSAKMIIDPSGNVGIGTLTPQAPLEVSRTGADTPVIATAYMSGTNASAFFVAETARGTAAAPTAVQAGDFLGAFGMSGYGTSSFNDIFAAVGGFAAENFTDTARGSGLVLGTTPLGTKDINLGMVVLPSGNVGIGTPADANGIPTAADKLQVGGDIRVGTTGTNGCIKNFAGTGIVGTCSSDRRLKKDITPFAPMLDRVTALRPVHYFWRADEFPNRHFGNALNYGLIAQDVEQVLPELVATDSDGYKAVDYSKLPLLTIQAVKELKAENDRLKQRVSTLERLEAENAALERRLTEIERLLTEVVSTARRR